MGNTGPEDNNGRKPDPQGGRIHGFTTKFSIFEVEAVRNHKAELERRFREENKLAAGVTLTNSEYFRLRVLNGGEPITVDQPPPPIDTRRERRGSVPRTIKPNPAPRKRVTEKAATPA